LAQNSVLCVDVPLSNYSLTPSISILCLLPLPKQKRLCGYTAVLFLLVLRVKRDNDNDNDSEFVQCIGMK